jgi:hypothetical protein
MRWYTCANLTQLYLVDHLSKLPFSQFCDTLVRSPRLEELELYSPSFMDVDQRSSQPYLSPSSSTHSSINQHTSRLLTELDSVPPSAHVTIYNGTDPSGLMNYFTWGTCRLAPLRIMLTTVLRYNSGKGLHLLSPDARPWSYDRSFIHFSALFRASQRVTKGILGAIPAHFDVSLLTTLCSLPSSCNCTLGSTRSQCSRTFYSQCHFFASSELIGPQHPSSSLR